MFLLIFSVFAHLEFVLDAIHAVYNGEAFLLGPCLELLELVVELGPLLLNCGIHFDLFLVQNSPKRVFHKIRVALPLEVVCIL